MRSPSPALTCTHARARTPTAKFDTVRMGPMRPALHARPRPRWDLSKRRFIAVRALRNDGADPSSQRLLVLNAGSSSLKFTTFAVKGSQLTSEVNGVFERIGDESNSGLLAKSTTSEKQKWDLKVVHERCMRGMPTISQHSPLHVWEIYVAGRTVCQHQLGPHALLCRCLPRTMWLRWPQS